MDVTDCVTLARHWFAAQSGVRGASSTLPGKRIILERKQDETTIDQDAIEEGQCQEDGSLQEGRKEGCQETHEVTSKRVLM